MKNAMAMAPYWWRNARENAPIHVRIRLKERAQSGGLERFVSGPIVRIFHDETGRLKRGGVLRFAVDWQDGPTSKDPNREPMPGGGQPFALDLSGLRAARFLEVYLAPSDDGYQVVWDQATPLLRSTSQPVNLANGEGHGVLLPADILRRAENPRWWHRLFP